MKKLICFLLFALSSAALAGPALPPINVTVKDASGKIACKTRTNTNGTFTTPRLEPGRYVVQFESNNVQGTKMIVISAGMKKVSGDSVAGARFSGAGIAMQINVGSGLKITGQVADASQASTAGRVKIINGKRYVYVISTTGSLAGRWVEVGSVSSLPVQGYGTDEVQRWQDLGNKNHLGAEGGGQ